MFYILKVTSRCRLLLSVLVIVSLDCCRARYRLGGVLPVTIDRISPFNSPYETYTNGLVLPFCEHRTNKTQALSFSKIFQGDNVRPSVYNISYQLPVTRKEVCRLNLSASDLSMLKSQIAQKYVQDLLIDDLLVTVPFGFRTPTPEGARYSAVTHLHFLLGYTKGHVTSADVSVTSDLILLPKNTPAEPFTLSFIYSVTWFRDSTPVIVRLYRYVQSRILATHRGYDIRWLPIINSFIFLLFITIILFLVVLRILRVKWLLWLLPPDEDPILVDEARRSQVNKNVLCAPRHRMLFSVIIGSGCQLFCSVLLGVIFFVLFKGCWTQPRIYVVLCTYPLTFLIGGYTSAYLYLWMGGIRWKTTAFSATVFYAGPVFILWKALDVFCTVLGHPSLLLFSATSNIIFYWLLASLPFAFLGSLWGRRRLQQRQFKACTRRLGSALPESQRTSPWIHVCCVGVLPCISFLVTFRYIATSEWGPYYAFLYGTIITSFFLLLYVTGLLSILCTYTHLNEGRYDWWWRSVVSGSFVSAYFMFYAFYYFLTLSHKLSSIDGTFFFSYALMVAWAIFQILGFVTFSSNYWFVTVMYSREKLDKKKTRTVNVKKH